MKIEDLKTKIFADGADPGTMIKQARLPYISGFTTNPTLMREAGINNYAGFAEAILTVVKDKPISFEVFADEFDEMARQARQIASWGDNVYVKIPITNTKGESAVTLVGTLLDLGIKVNVTAILTTGQVQMVAAALSSGTPAIISIFAGRIADTGRDPVPYMVKALEILKPYPHAELLWASPRQLLDIYRADEIGCHIVTVTHAILGKLDKIGYDLTAYSLDTVKMFYNDGQAAGYKL